ncbi:3-phosphoshikimate 1-carboxyvinyltransferase [Sediminibacillus dalangtanensis]|uniref:3-phosphoshikimate 1-carboxyvinyltransferase n=1 Tax=Sediminibacillus dalangtanensis TaxID=2729421 RepID=A0ABX7VRU2_9BACI|nr:3-phosphoshikimate 1-carboxyvinyltransferase [Sediminibacillus dalangtanensis]QTM99649.1 3-phosphoshikimate 1-carboxyvinyltransferase [Sediminibacillus dalangtanensis]
MAQRTFHSAHSPLTGELAVPGDKSISHRAVIFGSLAEGVTEITNFLQGEDCLRTIDAFRAMGVHIEVNEEKIIVYGKGKDALQEPSQPINLGNSGTTARLLIGVLAGLPYHFVLYGDDSLSRRPMDRVTVPLKQMGAEIDGRTGGRLLPLAVRGGKLQSIDYEPPVKSAQVKSCVLLAGLQADGRTTVIEKTATRNHTETMLNGFGATLDIKGERISINGGQKLKGTNVEVPGDISSAAFFAVAAALVPGSSLVLKRVGLNPTRTGILDVLTSMGAEITILDEKRNGGEAFGDIRIDYAPLKGTIIAGEVIPRLIDELPIVALLATQAEGETHIRNAEELRYKETDRIAAVAKTLQALGAKVEVTEDGMVIKGKTPLHGGTVDSYGDHRIGMMAGIASFVTDGPVTLNNPDCINISYPAFFEHLEKVTTDHS